MKLDLIWAADDASVAVLLVLVDEGRPAVRVATRAGYADMSCEAAVELFRALAPPGFEQRSAAAAGVVAGADPSHDVFRGSAAL